MLSCLCLIFNKTCKTEKLPGSSVSSWETGDSGILLLNQEVGKSQKAPLVLVIILSMPLSASVQEHRRRSSLLKSERNWVSHSLPGGTGTIPLTTNFPRPCSIVQSQNWAESCERFIYIYVVYPRVNNLTTVTESGCVSRVGSTSVAFWHSPPQHIWFQAVHCVYEGLWLITEANAFFPQTFDPLVSIPTSGYYSWSCARVNQGVYFTSKVHLQSN